MASDFEIQNLVSLNRLDELIIPEIPDRVIKMAASPRSISRSRGRPEVLREEMVQQIRMERIKQPQEEEGSIVNLKNYLVGTAA